VSHEEEEDADASRPPAAEVDPHEPTAVAHLPALAPVHARTALALVAGCLTGRVGRAASSCLRRSCRFLVRAPVAGRSRRSRSHEPRGRGICEVCRQTACSFGCGLS